MDPVFRRILTRRRVTIFAIAAAIVIGATAAYAAAITTGSTHLGAVSIPSPAFYANSVVTTNAGNRTGQLQTRDYLTVVFSQELDAGTLCPGAPTQTGTLTDSNATVTIRNNAAADGNDLLTVTAETSCADGLLHFGSLDLGSKGFLTSATGTFTKSTVALTQTATSATLTITLGTQSSGSYGRITSSVQAIYTPDPTLADTLGSAIGQSTALTASAVQF